MTSIAVERQVWQGRAWNDQRHCAKCGQPRDHAYHVPLHEPKRMSLAQVQLGKPYKAGAVGKRAKEAAS